MQEQRKNKMFKNYLKIALRNIRKNKGYTFINVCGLAIGIACCLVVFLYVSDELDFDEYHIDKDRIYRIATREESPTSTSKAATTCGAFAQALNAFAKAFNGIAIAGVR